MMIPTISKRLCVASCLWTFIVIASGAQSTAQDKYAVLIGVETYDPAVLGALKFAEDDAIALGKSLKELDYSVKVMTGQANISTAKPNTPAKILRVLKTQMNNCADGDTMIISLSGHGLQFASDEPDELGVRETYFCPEDADPADKASLLKISDVVELLRQCPASRKLLLIDACRNEFAKTSGQKKTARKLKLSSVHETRKNIPGGMTVIFSCDQKQFSFEHDELGHSVFSYFVIKYLSGNAEERYYDDGNLKLDGLTSFVRKKTNEYVFENNLSADGQSPVYSGTSADWILGKGINPVRSLLQRHLDWVGGKGAIRSLKSLKQVATSSVTTSTGTPLTYSQTDYVNPELIITDTAINGAVFNQGCSQELGWVTEMDRTVRPMDNEERDLTWLTRHPLGWIEMVERYDEFTLGERAVVDGVETTALILGDSSGSYVKIKFDQEGRIRESEVFSRGQKETIRPLEFRRVGNLQVVSRATVEIVNDTFRVSGTTTISHELNPTIDAGKFAIPANVPRNPRSVDIDKIVEEYNTFSQEYVAESEGTLSGVRFRKLSSNTMAVDLDLAAGVYENTDPGFWEINVLKPMFVQTNLAEADRKVVESGIILQVTYKTPGGVSAAQFYITQNDL